MISCKWWMDVRLIALNKNENLTKVQQFCSMSVTLFIPLKICNPSCVNFHTKIFFCCLIAVVYVPFQRNAFKLKEKMQFTKGANKLIVHVVSTRLLNPWHHLQSESHSIHLMVWCMCWCLCVLATLFDLPEWKSGLDFSVYRDAGLVIVQFYDFHYVNVITWNFVKRLWGLWQYDRICPLNLNYITRQWPMASAPT